MSEAGKIRRAVLEALSRRLVRQGYESLELEGFTVAAVESEVTQLWHEGLVDASRIPGGLGFLPDRVDPSNLTERGVQYLRKLREQGRAGGG